MTLIMKNQEATVVNPSSSSIVLGSMVNPSSSAIDIQSLTSLIAQINYLQVHATRLNMNPITNLVSPYFLYPSESLGTPLISMTLNIHNNNTLARVMWLALKSKNKLKFIDGSLPKLHRIDLLFEA